MADKPTAYDITRQHLIGLVKEQLSAAQMALSGYWQAPHVGKAEEATRVAHEALGTLYSLDLRESQRIREAEAAAQ